MKSQKLLLVILFASACSLACGSARAGQLRAGMAARDITPPLGYRMSGYFSERLSTGIKDPLLAKALVFAQDDELVALVFCDLAGISLDVSTRARERIADEIGIPVTHTIVAATHSHTGPLYFGALRAHFRRKAIEQHGRDPLEEVDYPALLSDRIVTAVRQAKSSLQPVRLAAGYGIERRLSFNRRFHMKTGPVRFNPGQLNPNIVRPAGPIDSEVGLISLLPRTGDKPLGALVSFALHLDTVGGTEYSADFPKHLQDSLRKTHGPDFVSFFGEGTCGDINHVDVSIRGRRTADEIGGMLGETVLDRLANLPAVEQPSLAIRSQFVDAVLQQYDAAEIEAAAELMERVADRQVAFLERVKAYKIMALGLRGEPTIPLEVQAVRLSDEVAVVSLPGEVFVEFGLAIKQGSPFETTLVIELANDAPGYIPTRKAFAEGSYETVNSRVRPGEGERMVETALRLLNELKSDANNN